MSKLFLDKETCLLRLAAMCTGSQSYRAYTLLANLRYGDFISHSGRSGHQNFTSNFPSHDFGYHISLDRSLTTTLRPAKCLKHKVMLLLLTGKGKLILAQILRKLTNQLNSWHDENDENAIVRMTIPA